jgi:hypothetical protein
MRQNFKGDKRRREEAKKKKKEEKKLARLNARNEGPAPDVAADPAQAAPPESSPETQIA